MLFYSLKLFRGPENYNSHEMQLIPALFLLASQTWYVVQMGENVSLPVDSIMDWQYVDNGKAGLSSTISLSKSNEFLIHFSGE